MSKHDEKVLELQAKIAAQEKESINLKCSYNTNCILSIDNEKYNLHVLDEDDLTKLLIKLNLYRLSALDLEMDLNNIKFGKYTITEWIEDIKTRIKMEKNKKYIKELKTAKLTLDSLLSDDKKTELKLAEIESLLK